MTSLGIIYSIMVGVVILFALFYDHLIRPNEMKWQRHLLTILQEAKTNGARFKARRLDLPHGHWVWRDRYSITWHSPSGRIICQDLSLSWSSRALVLAIRAAAKEIPGD